MSGRIPQLVSQSQEFVNSDRANASSSFETIIAKMQATLQALLEENIALRGQITQLHMIQGENAAQLSSLSNAMNTTQHELHKNIEAVKQLQEKINTLSDHYNMHTHFLTVDKYKYFKGNRQSTLPLENPFRARY